MEWSSHLTNREKFPAAHISTKDDNKRQYTILFNIYYLEETRRSADSVPFYYLAYRDVDQRAAFSTSQKIIWFQE